MFNISILKTESFKKGIALSTLLNFFSKGLSFCTTLLIAFYFGTSLETDVYFFVISTVTSVSLFITGCTTSVIIPEVMHLGENGHKEYAMRISNTILFAFVFLIMIPVLLFSVLPVQVFGKISQFKASIILEHRFYFSASSLILILITINTYLKEILSMYRFFTFPMVISMTNSIFTLISVPLLINFLGMKSVIIGVLLGNFINAFMLVWTLRRYADWRFSKITTKLSAGLIKRIIYSQAGYTATAASMFVPSYLLSGIGAGLIAALNFGRQVSDIPGNFLTAQFCAVSGIKFNELVASKKFIELDTAYQKSLSFLFSILCPVCGIVIIFSTEIIAILFGRGAFTSISTADAALFCRLFILSTPLIALDLLSSRILIAAKKIRESFWYQIGFNLLNIIIMTLLFTRFGAKAIPLSIFILYCLNLIVQPIMFSFLCPYIKYLKALQNISVTMILNGIFVFAIFHFGQWLKQIGYGSIIRLSVCSISYLMLVYMSNLFLNINSDLQNIIRIINMKIKSALTLSKETES